MKKVCMSYNEFMTKFKNADKGYGKKANIANKDAGAKNVDQELTTGPIKGSGTPAINKFSNQHMSNIKGKKSVRKAGTKK